MSCPTCQRNNGPLARRCLYCGAALSDRGEAVAEELLPSDLDQLVRQALSGGSARRVQEALAASTRTGGPPGRAAAPAAAGVMPPRAVPTPPPPTPVLSPPPPPAVASPPPALSAQLDHLVHLAQRARQGWGSHDAAATRQALVSAAEVIEQALEGLVDADPLPELPAEALQPVSAAPPLRLPPWRQPWLLVIDAPGDGDRFAALALALGVDNATARQLAVARGPKVALRGTVPEELQAAAERVRQLTSLPAVACSQDDLLDLPAARTVLRCSAPGSLVLTESAAWFGEVEVDAEQPWPAERGDAVHLVVPGEVLLRRYRMALDGGRGRRGRSLTAAGERRVSVVDVHCDSGILRFVEGVTALEGLPGHTPMAARRTLRAFGQDGAQQWWPSAHAVAARTCRPTREPRPEDMDETSGSLEAAGWPEWEEHTRLCRLLGLAGG